MASFLYMFFLSFAALQPLQGQSQEIKSAHLLDLVIRDYTLKSYDKAFKTGKQQHIHLPSNLSGINVDTITLRCGSLSRHGAKIEEFHLGKGVYIHPFVTRAILVRQNLGSNWSSLYENNYDLSSYQLISPILGLLAYNVGTLNFTTIPSELKLQTTRNPIIIDFNNTTLLNIEPDIIPLCASFDQDGKVSLSSQTRPNVCLATKHGHFGLVVENPLMPLKSRASKWKIAIGGSIGAALGAFLLSLLMVAMFVNAKKKAKMDELVRRAYEEEALQVSMVGHVRALSGSSTRTLPTIEHYEYRPHSSN